MPLGGAVNGCSPCQNRWSPGDPDGHSKQMAERVRSSCNDALNLDNIRVQDVREVASIQSQGDRPLSRRNVEWLLAGSREAWRDLL